MNFSKLTDQEIETQLQALVREENKLKIQILHLLAEVEKRRLFAKTFPSLFEYCVRVLKYSPSAAQRRIDSMRAMKLIPELETKIISGELNLSTLSMAQSFFRAEKKEGNEYSVSAKKDLLQSLENKSTREVKKILVTISPEAISKDRRREITEAHTELKITLDQETLAKLDHLKNLLSHRNLTDKELIEYLVDLGLKKYDPLTKLKKATTSNPLPAPAAKLPKAPNHPATQFRKLRTRAVPVTVRRAVWQRDQGKCTHVGCGSKKHLQLDHIHPFALGGEHSIENLRLLCAAHNQQAALEIFGKPLGKLPQFQRRSTNSKSAATPQIDRCP